MPKLLLTGATGFVGAPLLIALLRIFPSHTIVCLVRAADTAAGRKRLLAAIDAAQEMATFAQCAHRVTVLVGDIALPTLGLNFEDSVVRAALRGLKCVVHNGARVTMAQPWSLMAAVNVGSTSMLANLALDLDAAMVFISSLSAVGATARPTEADFTPANRLGKLTGYELQSRQLLWSALSLSPSFSI